MVSNTNIGPRRTRTELNNILPTYQMISDCLIGSAAVKARGDAYLPRPNAADVSANNKARYEAYIQRAMFYNIAKRTLDGASGQVFVKPPAIEMPPELEPVVRKANESGLSLTDVSKRLVMWDLSLGRAGVLTDYPSVGTAITKAQAEGIQPIIRVFHPVNVINWHIEIVGSRRVLRAVVLRDFYEHWENYEVKIYEEYIILQLTDAGVTKTVLRYEKNDAQTVVSPEGFMTDKNGQPLREIPFTFIGAIDNDDGIDIPPMDALCAVNIAHYRNSADYEELVYMVGQPTAWMSGLDGAWVAAYFPNGVNLGSRAIIPLPRDASAGLLQVEGSPLPGEAMKHKEQQMLALGAKLLSPDSKKVQTATETKIDFIAETSVVSQVADNVSAAVTQAMSFANLFVNGAMFTDDKFEFKLSGDVHMQMPSAEERAAAVKEWQAGALVFEEVREVLRKAGVATLPDDEAKAAAMEELKQTMTMEAKAGGNDNFA